MASMIVHVPCPANDNVLARVRPLTVSDVEIIADENALLLGWALDYLANYQDYVDDPLKGAGLVLANMPELQRAIVWRGSWLKQTEVEKLQLGGALIIACKEVIEATRKHHSPGVLEDIIRSNIMRFSEYLQKAAR